MMMKLNARIALVVCAVFSAMGSHTPVIGLTALRMLTLSVFFKLFIGYLLEKKYQRNTDSILLVSIVAWFVVAFFWQFQLNFIDTALNEFFGLIFGIMLLLVPIMMVDTRRDFILYVLKFWIISFLIATIFAILELFFNFKLESSYTQSQSSHVFDQIFIASTFDNPNNYAVFLLYCLPILHWAALKEDYLNYKIIFFFLILICIFQIIVTASRAGILAAILYILIYLLVTRKYKEVFIGLVVFLSVLFVIFRLVDDGAYDNLTIVLKLLSSAEDLDYGSTRERLNIYIKSLQITLENPFVGIGSGNFENYLNKYVDNLNFTVLNQHSMLLEISVHYGLFVCILFYLPIFYIYAHSMFLAIKSSDRDLISKESAVISAFFLPMLISHNINSTYLHLHYVWIFIGTMFAMYNFSTNKIRFAL